MKSFAPDSIIWPGWPGLYIYIYITETSWFDSIQQHEPNFGLTLLLKHFIITTVFANAAQQYELGLLHSRIAMEIASSCPGAANNKHRQDASWTPYLTVF